MIIHNSALADFGFPRIGDLSAFGGAGTTPADALALQLYDNALGYYRSVNGQNTAQATLDALHQYANNRANWMLQPSGLTYQNEVDINTLGVAAGLPVQFISSAAATAAATPSQNVFSQIAALVKTAVSTPGKLPGQIASDVSSDISSVVAKAMNIGGFAGQTIQGIIQLNAALGTMASAINSAILSGNRTKIAAALRDSDPMQNGSTMYHLINDPQNEDAADILSAVVFSPLIAALCFNPSDPNFGAAIENLTARPSPYTDILRDISTIAAQGMVGPTLVQKLSDIGSRLIQVVIGLPVGPATAFTVGILIATNLPQPPYMAIITKIINDPVAKKYMSSRGIPPLLVKKLIPDTIACMDAETPQQWVQCAEGVIDVVAPKLITNLKNHGVNFNDVKNIAGAAWDSGLDLDLMTDDDVYPGIDESWIALGVVGLVYIAQAAKLPTNTVIGKYFAVGNEKNVAKMIQQGLHFFETAVGVDEPFTNYDDAVQNPKTFTQKFMDAMKQAAWDVDAGGLFMFGDGVFDLLVNSDNTVGSGAKTLFTLIRDSKAVVPRTYKALTPLLQRIGLLSGGPTPAPTTPTVPPIGSPVANRPVPTPPTPQIKTWEAVAAGAVGTLAVGGIVGLIYHFVTPIRR